MIAFDQDVSFVGSLLGLLLGVDVEGLAVVVVVLVFEVFLVLCSLLLTVLLLVV